MSRAILIFLVSAAFALQVCLAQNLCEADNCNNSCYGRSNVNRTEIGYSWTTLGVNCTLCQLDCLVDGSPFQSCPCRYYRYGCSKETYCTSLLGLTKRQYDGALFLCKAMGCAFKTEILTVGPPDSNLYSSSDKLDYWREIKNTCAYQGATNQVVMNLRADFADCVSKGTPLTQCSADAVKFAHCERAYFRTRTVANINQIAPLSVRSKNPDAWKQVRSEQYRNYFVQMIDVPGTFFTYYAGFAEILYKKYSADLSAFNDRLQGNSASSINQRWQLFRIRPVEVTNILNQMEICKARRSVYPTRADAIAGLIENYIRERRALDKGDGLMEDDAVWTALDLSYYKDYIAMLADFGSDIDYYINSADEAREVAYPLIFPTTSGSERVGSTTFTVSFSSVDYFEPSAKKWSRGFYNKGSLCPSYSKKVNVDGTIAS